MALPQPEVGTGPSMRLECPSSAYGVRLAGGWSFEREEFQVRHCVSPLPDDTDSTTSLYLRLSGNCDCPIMLYPFSLSKPAG